MAKENIAFLVNLRKNLVPDSDMYGRYYPEAESKETLTTKGFAKHVSEHGGTLVTYEFMQLVMAAIVKCLKEMMSQGQPVKLDGLGTFRPTVTSVKSGAASIEEALRMGVNNLVEGVNFVFIPENAQGEELTSKKFKEQCSLQFAYLVESVKKVISGKERSYTLRTPLSAWGIIQAEGEESGSQNGSGSEQGGSGSGSGGSSTGSETGGGSEAGGGSSSETVEAPVISGETPFDESTQVSISGPDGAEIRYTTDGTAPNAQSSLYSEAITLSDTATVKAIAIKNGVSSEAATKVFTKNGSNVGSGGFETGN